MTARAYAVFDFPGEIQDAQEISGRLECALPEVYSVRAYWLEQSKPPRVSRPNSKLGKLQIERDKRWVTGSSNGSEVRRFHGPGGLSVWIWRRHGEIHSSCRWTGFLTINRLRHVHVKAFHRIASVFNGKSLIVMPSDSLAKDGLWEGATIEAAIAELEKEWGPPQVSTEEIAPDAIRVNGSPRAWFFEDVKYAV